MAGKIREKGKLDVCCTIEQIVIWAFNGWFCFTTLKVGPGNARNSHGWSNEKKNPSWLCCSRFSSLQALYFYLSFLWVSIRSLSCDCLYRIFQFSVILYVQISRKKRSCATKVLTILTLTAMPLRSEEAELPVWVVLGTVFVLVSLIMILDAGILKHLAATCKNIT